MISSLLVVIMAVSQGQAQASGKQTSLSPLYAKAKEALEQIHQGKTEEGETICKEVIKENPTIPDAWLGLGVAAALRNDRVGVFSIADQMENSTNTNLYYHLRNYFSESAIKGLLLGSENIEDVSFTTVKIIHQPPSPPYPVLAKIAKLEGHVVVEVTVDEHGRPVYATPKEGPPQLSYPSCSYVLRWRFENTSAIKSRLYRFKIKLNYSLGN